METLTAAEAKKISGNSKMSIGQVYRTINNMAKAGYQYATLQILQINNADELKSSLESNGYTVKIEGNYFNITW